MPKQTPKFAPGANGARMARAPTGMELKEVMRSHGTNASSKSLRSRPSRRLSFTGIAEPGDGFDDGREARGDAHAKAPAGQLAAANERVLEPPRRKCIIVSFLKSRLGARDDTTDAVYTSYVRVCYAVSSAICDAQRQRRPDVRGAFQRRHSPAPMLSSQASPRLLLQMQPEIDVEIDLYVRS